MSDPDDIDASATFRQSVSRLKQGAWSLGDDELAEEVGVALEYNGISHAVMMATPCDLEQFAIGFSLSEGIITQASEIHGIELVQSDAGITAQIEIASATFAHLKERRRSLTGRTGCGLCGVDSLAQVLRPLPALAPNRTVSARAIRNALAGIKPLQPINRSTGATHAALWADADGTLQASFEDVGRHNALDKLIGGMAMRGIAPASGFAVITSRASVEMVQKAATAGISALVAISAPTAMAVRCAEQCGMTLVAFARGDDFVAYAHGAHIVLD
jgi:FdhD protein